MEQLDDESMNSIISVLGNIMIKGDNIKAIQLLRNLKQKNIEITYLIDQILPFGDIIFYRYVKSVNRDMMNSFHTFDKILHTNDSNLILDLLKFDIIEPYYSVKVNKTDIATVIYMIIQLSDYDEKVKTYLFEKYAVNEEGLLRHMFLENVCNDVFVYIRACLENNMTSPQVLNFDRIIDSYQAMYDKYKNNEKDKKRLQSRLIGITQLINKQCLDNLLMLPEYEDYKKRFESFYESKQIFKKENSQLKQLLDKICYDSYEYVNFRVPWGSQR